ncbi:transcriptional regulator GcvA [Brevundimonas sp.]|jgi:LysR family glycine cleavage system transcriptional activator|uniref:transcriptional regulator GcvA n=1 Tax=Brevundimonas sp. TaxID=1871086 RepID=UPI0037BF815E
MNERGRRLLPPMGALTCFEAAARLGSFSRAGDEVGLTQSAVSRQILLLEDWLQTPLFDRLGRRVRLNADGRAYADQVGPALHRIRRATAKAIERRPENELNIATLASFGMRWLAPRLPRFTERYPEYTVNFAARTSVFEFADEPFDAAIHFGWPDWPGAGHDLLFQEQAFPVASPRLIAERGVTTPADLARLPLLFQESRRAAWAEWFDQAGVSMTGAPGGATYDHFLMLAQAAVAGAGVALIPSFLIEPELASGALVRPFDISVSSERAYYLVHPSDRTVSPALSAFRSWIVEEATA